MPSISKAKLNEFNTTIQSLTSRLERSEKQADEWKSERDEALANLGRYQQDRDRDGWKFREAQKLWLEWIVADKGMDDPDGLATIRFERATFNELLNLFGS